MTGAALALALGAAVLHAFWNLLLARADDVQAATGAMIALSVLVFAPVAAFTWDVEAAAAPYIVASGFLQFGYALLLAAGYRLSELSVVYPIARGVAPVLVLVVGTLVLGDATSAAQALGVVLVALGVVFVRGLRSSDRRGVAFGLATAVAIAGYTLVDSRGIDHANPVAYLVLALMIPAAGYALWLRPTRLRAQLRPWIVAAALAGFATYALVLAALRLAPAAPVAAVRETSVVIAVAFAAVFLRERVGAGRLGGAVAVAAGVMLLSL